MSREDDRAFHAQATDQLADLHHLLRVKADGGLVKDEHLRFVYQRLGDADALAIPLGQVANNAVSDLFQATRLHHSVDLTFALGPGTSLASATKSRKLRTGRSG